MTGPQHPHHDRRLSIESDCSLSSLLDDILGERSTPSPCEFTPGSSSIILSDHDPIFSPVIGSSLEFATDSSPMLEFLDSSNSSRSSSASSLSSASSCAVSAPPVGERPSSPALPERRSSLDSLARPTNNTSSSDPSSSEQRRASLDSSSSSAASRSTSTTSSTSSASNLIYREKHEPHHRNPSLNESLTSIVKPTPKYAPLQHEQQQHEPTLAEDLNAIKTTMTTMARNGPIVKETTRRPPTRAAAFDMKTYLFDFLVNFTYSSSGSGSGEPSSSSSATMDNSQRQQPEGSSRSSREQRSSNNKRCCFSKSMEVYTYTL
mmetsp:Transcript_18410/g.31615  ORF Transcript_18410/g.31615 Transcript_18410/m.31615 type:complete len:320 (+) Transcript_18410:262-1221(+)|eukprot:CAMPEP_0183763974 /NCGR_PEP_ID=MMETSP0739-20130205/10031_1 /TAXON_ID=385413 /ORGANISM="Thalassiosira miniscula, Strain CCMP1093" /LENGTH=319 /DNA_ID=CAMNT_0026002457 /DNA_START=261 /DNA_END=1220 /DNA_ORIENTATION=+